MTQTRLPLGIEHPFADKWRKEARHVSLIVEDGSPLGDDVIDDPKKLANIAAGNVRKNGIMSTLTGLQILGSGPSAVTADQYVAMMSGVARELMKG